MSDITTAVSAPGDINQLIYMVGRIDSKIDGLVQDVAELKIDHTTHVRENAREHLDIRASMLSGDATLALRLEGMKSDLNTRIDTVKATIETRIETVEKQQIVGATSRSTLWKAISVAGSVLVVFGGVITYFFPVLVKLAHLTAA